MRVVPLAPGNTGENWLKKKHATETGLGGGETGIRTLGGLAPTTVFETAPFDHSGTSPRGSVRGGFSEERAGVQAENSQKSHSLDFPLPAATKHLG